MYYIILDTICSDWSYLRSELNSDPSGGGGLSNWLSVLASPPPKTGGGGGLTVYHISQVTNVIIWREAGKRIRKSVHCARRNVAGDYRLYCNYRTEEQCTTIADSDSGKA